MVIGIADNSTTHGLQNSPKSSKPRWMIKNGITSFVEVGAGKVLTGLNKRIDKDVQSISVESPDAIEEFLKDLG